MPFNLRRFIFGRYFADMEQRAAQCAAELEKTRAELAACRSETDALKILEKDLTAERDALWLQARKDIYNLTFPPDHLQERVVGVTVPAFLWSGERIADEMEAIAAEHGINFRDASAMLDYGCGVARVTRIMAARYPGAAHTGADIDPEAIAWCNDHLDDVARFVAIPHNPPADFATAEFDFVYSISVFTHLPEDMQFAWLEELRRITAPGGHLLLSFQGEDYYYHVPTERKVELDEKGFAYVYWRKTDGLPDFYQVAVHTPDYIRREWGRYFDVLGIYPRSISGKQDAVLLKRRD